MDSARPDYRDKLALTPIILFKTIYVQNYIFLTMTFHHIGPYLGDFQKSLIWKQLFIDRYNTEKCILQKEFHRIRNSFHPEINSVQPGISILRELKYSLLPSLWRQTDIFTEWMSRPIYTQRKTRGLGDRYRQGEAMTVTRRKQVEVNNRILWKRMWEDGYRMGEISLVEKCFGGYPGNPRKIYRI